MKLIYKYKYTYTCDRVKTHTHTHIHKQTNTRNNVKNAIRWKTSFAYVNSR